jgi:hypothetical protein
MLVPASASSLAIKAFWLSVAGDNFIALPNILSPFFFPSKSEL